MGKVNEGLLHITTDLTYVSQDALNADGGYGQTSKGQKAMPFPS